ncbi:MAG: hypothetical protein ING44_03910 [Telmatospirillum sp.]|nr:hypothetical protein [Telmatospirillum sp.]
MTGAQVPHDEAARVRDLADDIANTRRESAKKLLREANLPQPGFVWNPDADLLPVPVLASLRRLWDIARAACDMPTAAQFEHLDLGTAAGDVAWAEPAEGEFQYGYRRIGTRLAAAGGTDAARNGLELGLLLRAVLAAAAARRKAIFLLHSAPAHDGRQDSWARLTLPLAADPNGPVCGFLVGALPMATVPVAFGGLRASS